MIRFLAILAISNFLFACQSSRGATDKYDYLRKKEVETSSSKPDQRIPEPYEVIDIAVLDTAQVRDNSTTPSNTDTDTAVSNPTAPANIAITTVLEVAKSFMGTPYLYGGNSLTGIDCSGLVFASFLSIDMTLPRTSRALATAGKEIKKSKIKAGDLVFFSSRKDGNINHVGLVTETKGSEISFIHATVSRGVREDRLDVGYWSERYIKAVRVK